MTDINYVNILNFSRKIVLSKLRMEPAGENKPGSAVGRVRDPLESKNLYYQYGKSKHCTPRVAGNLPKKSMAVGSGLAVGKKKISRRYRRCECCVPQAGIEPTFSRPQRDALTTGLSGPTTNEKHIDRYSNVILLHILYDNIRKIELHSHSIYFVIHPQSIRVSR